MRLLLIGTDYRMAPVEVRERLAFPDTRAGAFAKSLCTVAGIEEACVLSTCNRTEFLVAYHELGAGDVTALPRRMLRLVAETTGVAEAEPGAFYVKHGAEAVRHALRVACGLESMIIGEGHILSQVKKAYRRACIAGVTGPLINKTMHAAFRAGKRARGETGIGRGAVSVSLAAVQRACRCIDGLSGRTVVIVGAGHMARSTVEHLRKRWDARIVVVNRTLERATDLARRAGGEAVPLAALPGALADADLVIAAATCTRPLIDKPMVAAAMRNRTQRPLVLIDTGVPRCIDSATGHVEHVVLRAIDDLRETVDQNLLHRRTEIPAVEAIVEEEIATLYEWYYAPGQGALVVEIRADNEPMARMIRAIDDPSARLTTAAERAFLAELGSGCRLPIGVRCYLNGDQLLLGGMVSSADGELFYESEQQGRADEAELIGRRLAGTLLAMGADRILAEERARMNGDKNEGSR